MFHLLMKPPRKVFVAVSGGPDSMAAVDFLKNNHSVTLLHFNHGTEHGKEAAVFVVEYAKRKSFLLSNFYPCSFTLDGKEWPSSEHYFMAQKTLDKSIVEKIRLAPTPGKAKRIGRHLKLRPDWELIKYEVMVRALRAKFTQNDQLAARLISTGDALLIEGNTWGDRIWGMVKDGKGPQGGQWQGLNYLGNALMQVRKELS